MTIQNSTTNFLELCLKNEGLLFLGAVNLEIEEDFKRYELWLQQNKHAGMSYLENHQELRRNPEKLLPGVHVAIIFAYRYASKASPNEQAKHLPKIAKYAQGKDYHKHMRQRAERTWKEFSRQQEREYLARICIDSAPLLERALAAKTTQGFIAKNSCYIHPEWGSYLLLGSILTDFPFVPTTPRKPPKSRSKTEGGCGSCKRCQVHCPTQALNVDFQVDANLCLSYWTIEHRGVIPKKFWPHLKQYWYGCDICQDVCPYNRKVPEIKKIVDQLDLFEVATMDQKTYEKLFGGTALTRAKRQGLRRNALIALFVSKHPKSTLAAEIALNSEDKILQDTAREILLSEA